MSRSEYFNAAAGWFTGGNPATGQGQPRQDRERTVQGQSGHARAAQARAAQARAACSRVTQAQTARAVAILLCVSLVLAGCGRTSYRAETAWSSTGRLQRTLVLPSADVNEEALEQWSTVDQLSADAGDDCSTPLDKLPVLETGVGTSLRLTGKFESPEFLPATLRIKAPELAQFGTLRQSSSRRDWGLVTEYRWSETLTDVVSLSGMQQARGEAVELLSQILEEICRQESHDGAALENWLRNDFGSFVADLQAAGLALAAARAEETTFQRELLLVCERHGLHLGTPEGQYPARS